MSNTTPKILQEIHREIINGSLNIPVLPQVALRVRDSCRNKEQGVAELVQLIQSDSSLSAFLMQVSSSTFFSRISKPKTLLQAVNRLGLSCTRDLTVVYCVKALFTSRNAVVRRLLHRQWERSTYIASISSILAAKSQSVDPDRALLGGLLQDIGSLPVLEKMSSYLTSIESENTVNAILDRYSSMVGVTILESWDFDLEFIDVVRSREDWHGEDYGELADVIMIARLHSYVNDKRMLHLPRINEIPAFKKLNLSSISELTPELSLSLLEDAKEDITDLHQSLM